MWALLSDWVYDNQRSTKHWAQRPAIAHSITRSSQPPWLFSWMAKLVTRKPAHCRSKVTLSAPSPNSYKTSPSSTFCSWYFCGYRSLARNDFRFWVNSSTQRRRHSDTSHTYSWHKSRTSRRNAEVVESIDEATDIGVELITDLRMLSILLKRMDLARYGLNVSESQQVLAQKFSDLALSWLAALSHLRY